MYEPLRADQRLVCLDVHLPGAGAAGRLQLLFELNVETRTSTLHGVPTDTGCRYRVTDLVCLHDKYLNSLLQLLTYGTSREFQAG